MSKDKVITHPSSRKLQGDVWARFTKLQKEHHNAMQRAWAGTLALHFSDDELRVITASLSPNDFALLKQMGRKVDMPKNVKRIIND